MTECGKINANYAMVLATFCAAISAQKYSTTIASAFRLYLQNNLSAKLVSRRRALEAK